VHCEHLGGAEPVLRMAVDVVVEGLDGLVHAVFRFQDVVGWQSGELNTCRSWVVLVDGSKQDLCFELTEGRDDRLVLVEITQEVMDVFVQASRRSAGEFSVHSVRVVC
jgi:hypothetical protein